MLHSSATRQRLLITDIGKSLTVLAGSEDTDINVIVRRFGLTGQLPQNVRVPLAGDFYDVEDFQSAMQAVRLAQESFDAMPADVRAEFENDTARFVEFTTERDEKGDLVNLEAMRKMGLAVPAEVVPELAPLPVRVVADPPVV